MSELKSKAKKAGIVMVLLALVSFLIAGIASGAKLDSMLNEVAYVREVSDLNSLAWEQKQVIDGVIERQFEPVEFLASYLNDKGMPAAELEKNQSIVDALATTNGWRTVGYAGLDGEVFCFKGENPGNISKNTFFREIAYGNKTHTAELLTDAGTGNELCALFAVPLHKDNEVEAVLFVGKEITFLESSLLLGDEENGNVALFVVSGDGKILCANEVARSRIDGDNYYSCHEKTGYIDDFVREEHGIIIENFIYRHENDEVVSCCSTEVGGLKIIAEADKNGLETKYKSFLTSIRRQSAEMMIEFGAMLMAVVITVAVMLKLMTNAEKKLKIEKTNREIIMKEMGCELFVYDIDKDIFETDGILLEKLGIDVKTPLKDLLVQQQALHPECDFGRLRDALNLSIETGKKVELVFVISFNMEFQWIKLTLFPCAVYGNKLTHVMGSFLNVTEEHIEFAKNAEMLANMPGGFHRCYLSDPIHVEYVSNGLCTLLGYTRDELAEIMVGDDYSQAVYEKDRERFEEFVYHMAENPGSGVCEYRMVKKDGSLVSVSDTMESILTITGVMYGYSVVSDISSFTSEIENLTDELENAKIKNSLSQMQPHFLYNALASIREIVLYDPEYASDLIVDFTTHLRACIKAMSSNDLIPFTRELENIRAYVNIERMRFGEKLRVKYNISVDNFMIVPLTIQPLVENAIRHGIYHRGAAGGTVTISTYKEEQEYVISVEDDGVGFDYEKMMGEIKSGQRDSTGLISLVFRLEKMLKAKVEIESHIGRGTAVKVTIPFQENNSEEAADR